MAKVLHIITRLDRGGSAEAVMRLTEGLRRDGYCVKLVTGRTTDPQEDVEEFSARTGVPVVHMDELRREVSPINDLKALIKLRSLIAEERPEIVHTHSSKAGILGRIAARLAGCPVVVHSPHGHVFYGYFGRLRTLGVVLAERLAAHITDRIFTLTELGKRDHLRFGVGSPDKFVVVPCGIDISKFSSPKRSRKEVREEFGFSCGVVVGWVGRLVPIKGCEYFLRALKIVMVERPEVKGLVVGDGPLREDLEELSRRLGISGKVVFSGARDDVPELMQAMDILVLTSLNEGLGRVILEAMACGVPVVASSVGGVPEIVVHEETGLLVPPADPRSTADAILKLLNDPYKAQLLSRKGRERAKLFDIKAMVKRTEEVYRKLLEKYVANF